ncbi:MAG TPA: 7-cyano-7-deazaguanine synthase QueC [Rickettsiales bacterium]|nr:7-cyano-7-deazaguanine synthase QueC [Rickettsiales bacterium]
MKKAIILLSGGVDSTTTLAIAKNQGFACYALSFDYGQRHKIELEFAREIAVEFDVVEHKIAKIDLRIFGGSALTAEIEVPKNAPQSEEIPITYVPARNTIFLSYALAYGEVVGAFDIFIGANAVDYSNYPDCRENFLQAYEKMANLATAASQNERASFKIRAPLLKMSKAEIIKTGIALGIDYSKTHSCYDPIIITDGKIIACGKCDSCQFRLKGFREAGL